MANWRLELDQRMSLIMIVRGNSFTVGAKICIMADCAFVSVATDVGPAVSARTEGAIAVNATMYLRSSRYVGDRLV